jgi:DnaK suppressor protein
MSLRVVSRSSVSTEKKQTYLDHKTLKALRDRLHTQKQFLMDEVDRFLEQMMLQEQHQGDEIDQVQSMNWFNLRLDQCQREKQLLVYIDKALRKIDLELGQCLSASFQADGYGYCECCEAEIGAERLQANPVAALCIECKEEQEIAEQ